MALIKITHLGAEQGLKLLKKLEIKLPYDPIIPLLGINPEKTTTENYTCTPMSISALFTIART